MPGDGDFVARDFRAAGNGACLKPRLDREHGGEVDRWAKLNGIEAREIVDFSASINPLGPPGSARRAFLKSYAEISRYPDPYGNRLKEALAKRHDMEPAQVLLGNGSTQLIYFLCAALRPRTALIVGPAFAEYANALQLAGATVRTLVLGAENGFRFSANRFAAAWASSDIAFIATPNSVTGQLIARLELAEIARLALARKSFVIIDEAFIDFAEAESIKALVRENPYLLVLRSLTKYYALPGLRLGFLFGEARRVAQLAVYQEPWSVNTAALNVALACLEDPVFAAQTERWLKREKKFLFERLAALKAFRPLPSGANFLLVKVEDGRDALTLRSFLLHRKILIRACDSFAGLGADYFRVAIRRRDENRRLLEVLAEWSA
jgi:threonine-phosphate decarboxylase